MRLRRLAPLLAAGLLLGLLQPAGALPALSGSSGSESTGTELFANSPNMAHVAQLKHQRADGPGDFYDFTAAQNGTDIEFATIAIPVGVDEQGSTVYEDRDYALAGSYQHGLQIVNITDPEEPERTGIYDCGISQGDVQVFTRDGRTYVTYTADNGYAVRADSVCVAEAKTLGLYTAGGLGTYIADITDPVNPVTVSFYGNPSGSHNQTVAPGGEYLYNSNSDIGPLDRLGDTGDQTGRIEVIDIRDFSAPQEVARIPLETGADSHDITFSEDGNRAYTAALTHTLILDTTDLANPSIVGRIVDPAINIHHQSDPVTLEDATTGLERTFLVVTDEIAGAAGNAVCPGGGLHIYDITGDLEAAPVKVGFWNMPSVRFTGTGNITCTSHVLRLYPEAGIMTIAWYNAGVRVVDISGLTGVSVGAVETVGNVGAGMKEIGYFYFPDSDTWSAKAQRIEEDGSFYVFGNDMRRGLDVYRFDAGAAQAEDAGTWLTPSQALAQAQARSLLAGGQSAKSPICLLRGRSGA